MKNTTKILALLLILSLIAATFGCTQNSEQPSASQEPEAAPHEEAPADAEPVPSEQPQIPSLDERYPLADHDVTLSIYMSMPGNTMSYFADMRDQVAFAKSIDRLGVDLEFVTSSMGNAEQYALWAASEEFPDILTVNPTSSVSQGVDYAVENGIFLALNDYLDEYAPEYEAYRTRSEDSIKASISDGGNIVSFETVVLENDNPATGPMIRKDWLDALGLDIPTTYDDWHDVLAAFKSEYDPYAALMLPESTVGQNNTLIAGYGIQGFEPDTSGSGRVAAPLYQIDGTVYFSLSRQEYKDYIEMLSGWYSENLIAPDFISISSSTMGRSDLENYVITDKTGIWVGEMRTMSEFEANAASESFEICAIPDAVITEGDQLHFDNDRTGRGETCVYAGCEYPEIAVAWCNYWFTDEGQDIVNWGIEGAVLHSG